MKRNTLKNQLDALEAATRQRLVAIDMTLRELKERLPAYPDCAQLTPEQLVNDRLERVERNLRGLDERFSNVSGKFYEALSVLGVEHQSARDRLVRPGILRKIGRGIARLFVHRCCD